MNNRPLRQGHQWSYSAARITTFSVPTKHPLARYRNHCQTYRQPKSPVPYCPWLPIQQVHPGQRLAITTKGREVTRSLLLVSISLTTPTPQPPPPPPTSHRNIATTDEQREIRWLGNVTLGFICNPPRRTWRSHVQAVTRRLCAWLPASVCLSV